ncbi:MAG: ATP-binding protein [Polaromonas sp.]|nr:ATP-binding protein [Polaromonas sp.]
MTVNWQVIENILRSRAQEAQALEFKRGASLGKTNEQRKELVKDCTGFANASGGLIIYGVDEVEEEGIKVAAGLSAIVDQGIDSDWISNVLRSQTMPPLNGHQIFEFNTPDNSGKIIAIDIPSSSTAHQNLYDHKYYQRGGVTTSPMIDFQIRDVMSRRTGTQVLVEVNFDNILISSYLHRRRIKIKISNTGTVTLDKWWFEIDIPSLAVKDTSYNTIDVMKTQGAFHRHVKTLEINAASVQRVSFGDPDVNGIQRVLHPGQSTSFGGDPYITLEVDAENYKNLKDENSNLHWKLFRPNEKPLEGSVPFDEWCRF